MTLLHYFAYGSNLHPHRLGRRVPSARIRARAVLPGYRLAFHKRGADGSGKCDVVPDPGAAVHGVVYTMTADEKPLLDAAEGLHRGYQEQWMTLRVAGQPLKVFFYRAQDSHIAPGLIPFDWYKAFVVEGARHHGLPMPYVTALRAVTAMPDSDRTRQTSNGMILREPLSGT